MSIKSTIWQTTDTLFNLVAQLGTNKDKRSHGQFGFRELTDPELEAMYLDWLSGKVVDAPVDDATRKWRTITAPSIEGRIEEVRTAEMDLNVQGAFNDAQKWASLYRGAVIVMVTEGDTDAAEPLDPLTIKPGDLKRLEVFDSTQVTPVVDNTNDVMGTDYRRPSAYSVDGANRIHASRVLRFDGVRLPWSLMQRYNYWGASRLQRFYDALRDQGSVSGSIASMVYEAKLDVISVPDLYQELASPNGLQKIMERFKLGDMLKSFNNTLLLDDREKFQRNATQFAGLPELMTKFMLQVSAASDIPVTRLFGQSAMGLNATGEGDERNYDNMISGMQSTRFGPEIRKFDAVFSRSVLGDQPEDWKSKWNSLREMTEAETAKVELDNSARDEKYLNADVVPRSVVAAELKTDGVYAGIDDEYIDALKDVEAAPDPAFNEGM